MWSIENACIRIILSHKGGRSYTIDKWPKAKLKNKWTENEAAKALVQKIVEHKDGEYIYLEPEEIELFAQHSNSQVNVIHVTMACDHKGTLKEKDHGTWIGWYCSRCGAGGSKSKSFQKRKRY